jgi:hypothetical protein
MLIALKEIWSMMRPSLHLIAIVTVVRVVCLMCPFLVSCCNALKYGGMQAAAKLLESSLRVERLVKI